ncbi:MAG TPA: hypothetical protein EYG60_01305 [Campylobacterales bacterium]|nr:hypothetical protein [Campylobacterales bacterium]
MRWLLLLLFSFFLFGQNVNVCKCSCPKIEVLFENQYEKLFEFKGKIYRILKGNERKDSILMILDEKSNKYIKIDIVE